MLGLTKSIEGILRELTKLDFRVNNMDMKLDNALTDVLKTVADQVRKQLKPDFNRRNADLQSLS